MIICGADLWAIRTIGKTLKGPNRRANLLLKVGLPSTQEGPARMEQWNRQVLVWSLGKTNIKGRCAEMTIRLFLLLAALMALGVTTVFAAKPSDPDHNVVAMSNGFPSGPALQPEHSRQESKLYMPTRTLRWLGFHSRVSN